MVKIFTVILFIWGFSTISFTQVDDPSCQPPKKKTQKLIDKAKGEANFRDAVLLFREAIDNEPDNATPYFEFASNAYQRGMQLYNNNPDPRLGDSYMKKAEGLYQKTLERCSDFHSDCYYYLGIINYSFGNEKQAMRYFKAFEKFDSPDVDRYSEDRTKRLKDVAEVLTKYEEEQSFLDNPVPYSPQKVKNVSSDKDEYFPMLSPDNELLFYTRKLDRSSKGDIVSNIREEFTYSKRKNNHSLFDGGRPLPPPFNDGTFDSYGASTLSVDNKEMIICACKDEKVQGQIYRNCDLYITHYERTGEGGNDYIWTPLENLGEGINTNTGWEGQPSLSADGNTLYFTANRPTTQNDDIFISERLPDGSWGPARPFDIINTPGKDKSPFIHQDSETFYFVSSVSNSRKGLGGTDIFYMRKDDNGNWTKPKNIGYPINTMDDEIGVFVSMDGEKAYFSSRQKGNWDIYSFDLYQKARPKKVAIIKGKIAAKDIESLEDIKLEISYANSDKVEEVRVNGNDGEYAAVVHTEEPQDIMVNVKEEGFAFDSKIITKEELSQTKDGKIDAKNMEMKEIKLGEPYTINDILFGTASDELSKRSQFILKQFGRFLKENQNISVLIQGHTDNVGDPAKNLNLSERRAESVKNFLIKIGISKNRLEAEGYGDTVPKVPNNSPENRQKNRRTDFVIQEM